MEKIKKDMNEMYKNIFSHASVMRFISSHFAVGNIFIMWQLGDRAEKRFMHVARCTI